MSDGDFIRDIIKGINSSDINDWSFDQEEIFEEIYPSTSATEQLPTRQQGV